MMCFTSKNPDSRRDQLLQTEPAFWGSTVCCVVQSLGCRLGVGEKCHRGSVTAPAEPRPCRPCSSSEPARSCCSPCSPCACAWARRAKGSLPVARATARPAAA